MLRRTFVLRTFAASHLGLKGPVLPGPLNPSAGKTAHGDAGRSSAQPAVLTGAGHRLRGHGTGTLGAVAQHLVDVVEVGRELGPLGAVRSEEIPVVLEQRLLQVT